MSMCVGLVCSKGSVARRGWLVQDEPSEPRARPEAIPRRGAASSSRSTGRTSVSARSLQAGVGLGSGELTHLRRAGLRTQAQRLTSLILSRVAPQNRRPLRSSSRTGRGGTHETLTSERRLERARPSASSDKLQRGHTPVGSAGRRLGGERNVPCRPETEVRRFGIQMHVI